VKSLKEVIDFNMLMKVKQCPTLNKKPLISSNEKGVLLKKYIAVKKSHLGSKEIIDKVIQ
jgi:hypothetical protein